MPKRCYIMNNLLVAMNKDRKWGAFNKELELVLPFEYDSIYSKLEDGREVFYSVSKDWVYGFVPENNVAEFIPQNDDWDGELAFNLIREKNGKYGITDIRGDFLILPIYDKIEVLSLSESYNYYDMGEEEKMLSDRFLLYKDGKVGFADYSKVLCSPIYDKISAVEEPYKVRLEHIFLVEKDGLFGYIDAQGNLVCEVKYDEIDYPCVSVLSKATCGNTIDIVNVILGKVVYSVEKDAVEYITIDYNHCCIANKLENIVYVLDSEGKVVTKFDILEEIKGYEVCYINNRFLGYQKPFLRRYRNSLGLIDYCGKVLTQPKYSSVIPIKGTYTVVAKSLFSKECELLDEDCNVVMNNFISLGSLNHDDEFGFIPPLLFEEFNSDDMTTYYLGKDLDPDKKGVFSSPDEMKVVDLFPHEDELDIVNRYDFEQDGKKYVYYIPKRENKIIVLNEDKSVYKSIEFEIANREDY